MVRYLPYVRLVLTEISPGSSGEAREEEVYVGSRVQLPPLHPRHDTSNAWREQNRLPSSSLSLAGLQGLHKPDRTGSSTQLSPFLSLSLCIFLSPSPSLLELAQVRLNRCLILTYPKGPWHHVI